VAASSVVGINNAGDLLGSFLDDEGSEIAFIRLDGTFENVRGRIGNGFITTVWSAQDSGRVMVGHAMRPDGGLHGYVRFGANEVRRIDFPDLPAPCTAPRWINQRGEIVGLFAIVDNGADCLGHPPHGFLLRDGVYTRIDFPGSAATTVFSMNDDGVLVGRFTDSQGRRHGYKAVPR
jgi:hypothetical protein